MKKTKQEWDELVKQHQNGKSINDILAENDIKKSTFRYHLKKSELNQPSEEPTEQPLEEHTEQAVDEPAERPTATAVVRMKGPSTVTDSFLDSFGPPATSQASYGHGSLVDGLFSMEDIFQPETLTEPIKVEEPVKSKGGPGGKSKSWWLSAPKKEKTKKEEQIEEDDEQLCLVQKIGLYFIHFPELAKLHIVTRKRGTEEPDTEKWLISLYSKKTTDLEKILNFVRFHTRNSLNENSSIKLASNILETGVKVLEHALVIVGVQAQGLTKDVVADQDIIRCIKEILIDNSVTSLNMGPRSDLALKIGMKIVQQDSQNRIERQMMQATSKGAQPDPKPSRELSPGLQDKYSDL